MPHIGTLLRMSQKTLPPGSWQLLDNFTDGDYTSNPAWTVRYPTNWTVSSGKLVGSLGTGTAATNEIAIVGEGFNTGTWATRMDRSSGYAQFSFTGCRPSSGIFINSPNFNGTYFIRIDGSTLYLYRGDGATCETCSPTDVLLTSTAYTSAPNDVYRVDRNSSGLMHVYVNGVLKLTFTDNTYTTVAGSNGVGYATNGSATFDDLYYSTDPTKGASPIG